MTTIGDLGDRQMELSVLSKHLLSVKLYHSTTILKTKKTSKLNKLEQSTSAVHPSAKEEPSDTTAAGRKGHQRVSVYLTF